MSPSTSDPDAPLSRFGRGAVNWLIEGVIDAGPRIPVRDRATLRAHHPGCSDDEIADSLTRTAGRATATIGAAGGALAAAEFVAPATLLGAPMQIVTETLAVVLVELKLVAELHAVYGVTVAGNARERATAYTIAWARRRGAEGLGIGGFGRAARRELQNRMLRRLGRTTVTMAPLLAGAAAGAALNMRETHKLGEKLVKDLRRRRLLQLPDMRAR
ncbi:MAG: hypothetical protein ACJ735_11415 [Actinomycetes bacterium]